MHRKTLYIIYKRLRPAFGLFFGFTIMYGVFVNGLSPILILIASAFMLMEVYGGLYNDYWDYEEDVKNKRIDKLTTSGILSRNAVKNISFLLMSSAVFMLIFTNIFVLLVGIYCAFLPILYSNPRFRMKGNLHGYMMMSSVFFLLPLSLNTILLESFYLSTFLFSFYCYFQFLYILCQKDSTDMHDEKNLFIAHNWKKASWITTFTGIVASMFLLIICIFNPILIFVWAFNVIFKYLNIRNINNATVSRTKRGRFVLMEFITPYLYLLGGVI